MTPTPSPAAAPEVTAPPSPWVRRWASLLPSAARVLDVACGSGRHLAWLAAQGHRLTGVDRDAAALQGLALRVPGAELQLADIENGPWPWPGRRFDAVVVTNYLWRPLWPTLLTSLESGGVLIYETFADGQQTIGRPSRPEFLLQRGELLQRAGDLQIVAFEDGFLPDPPRFVQRLAAIAGPPAGARHGLAGPTPADG